MPLFERSWCLSGRDQAITYAVRVPRSTVYGRYTTTRPDPSSIVHAGLSLDSLAGLYGVWSLVLAAFSLSLGLIIPLLTYSGTILWLHFGSTLSFIALEFYALRLYG